MGNFVLFTKENKNNTFLTVIFVFKFKFAANCSRQFFTSMPVQYIPIEFRILPRRDHVCSSPSILHSRRLLSCTSVLFWQGRVFCVYMCFAKSFFPPAASLVRAMPRTVFVVCAFLQLGPARPVTLHHDIHNIHILLQHCCFQPGTCIHRQTQPEERW